MNTNRGFTLIEVMVTIAIFIIIITPMTVLTITMYKTFNSQNLDVNCQSKAREIMTMIIEDLRRYEDANTAVTTTVVTNDTLNVGTYYGNTVKYVYSTPKLERFSGSNITTSWGGSNEIITATFSQTTNTIISITITYKYYNSGTVTLTNKYTRMVTG